jgi:hypothetical protein
MVGVVNHKTVLTLLFTSDVSNTVFLSLLFSYFTQSVQVMKQSITLLSQILVRYFRVIFEQNMRSVLKIWLLLSGIIFLRKLIFSFSRIAIFCHSLFLMARKAIHTPNTFVLLETFKPLKNKPL